MIRNLRRGLLGPVIVVAAAVFAQAASAAAPVNTDPPSIGGMPHQGSTLTADNGTWQNAPSSFRYQWGRCTTSGGSCVAISGATAKTYAVSANDVGHTLRVRVTAVNADGNATVDSAPTAVATGTPAAPKNTERPTISGSAQVGDSLTADAGGWSGNPDSFAYQWQRCDADGSNCGPIAGATGKTYPVRAADLGFRLRVQVTARNEKGTGTTTSGVTAIVEPAARIT